MPRLKFTALQSGLAAHAASHAGSCAVAGPCERKGQSALCAATSAPPCCANAAAPACVSDTGAGHSRTSVRPSRDSGARAAGADGGGRIGPRPDTARCAARHDEGDAGGGDAAAACEPMAAPPQAAADTHSSRRASRGIEKTKPTLGRKNGVTVREGGAPWYCTDNLHQISRWP